MTRVYGSIKLVTNDPPESVAAHVASYETRVNDGNLVLKDKVPVTVSGDGSISFDVLPGMAVLSVQSMSGRSEAIMLGVSSAGTQTLEEAVLAGSAGVENISTAERLLDLTFDNMAQTRQAMERTREHELAAKQALVDATKEADRSESEADRSESEADRAGQAAGTATEQADVASGAAATATEQAQVASDSADAAAVSEESAKSSEQAAKQSETNAKSSEDRAANIAGSTRWVGTKLEVNGQLSPDLKGDLPVVYSTTPPEDTDVIWVNPDEELPAQTGISGGGGASGLVSWESVTGKPAEFPPAAHTHTAAQVDGLDEALAGKAPASHTHVVGDVTGLQAALDGKAPASHTHSQYATTAQVEARTPEIRTVSSPELATSPGVLYVVKEG